MRRAIIWIIGVYQRFLSPDHGILLSWRYPYGYCKFIPSCSEYARQAFVRYSMIKALSLSINRLFHCTPWSKGGMWPHNL